MCIRILFVVLIGTTLLCGGQAFATITYGFISSSTGFQGQITIDENHASFSPGSTISLGGAITDFVFTYEDNGGLNTYTPSDLEIVQLALQFSASGVAPDDIVFAQGSYRDTALPQGGNIRFEFGGISSGGSTATNGNFTGLLPATSRLTTALSLLGSVNIYLPGI